MPHLERRESRVPMSKKPIRTVMNVQPHECRWVTDLVTVSGFKVFCAEFAPKLSRPYCKDHYPLVYVPQEKRK
jgi:hypothetical protein